MKQYINLSESRLPFLLVIALLLSSLALFLSCNNIFTTTCHPIKAENLDLAVTYRYRINYVLCWYLFMLTN